MTDEELADLARRAHKEATEEGLHTSRAIGRAVAAVAASKPEWTASEALAFVRRALTS